MVKQADMLADKETEKQQHYCAPEDLDPRHKFVPFVMNEFGRLGCRAEQLLVTLAERAGAHHGVTDDAAEMRDRRLRRWRGMLSHTVGKAMAKIVVNFAAAAK